MRLKYIVEKTNSTRKGEMLEKYYFEKEKSPQQMYYSHLKYSEYNNYVIGIQ